MMKILGLNLSFLCTVLSQNIATKCSKHIQVTGHDTFAGYYSYHGVSSNKPSYYNPKKNMYLYAIKNGHWHFNKYFGHNAAMAFMKPSDCPAGQSVSVWDASLSKWFIDNKIVINSGLSEQKPTKH